MQFYEMENYCTGWGRKCLKILNQPNDIYIYIYIYTVWAPKIILARLDIKKTLKMLETVMFKIGD